MFFQLSEPEWVFRLARIQSNRDWILPVAVLVILVYWTIRRYRIDGAELHSVARGFLLSLRILVLLSLFVCYLKPQWDRIEGESRVAVLLDTSSSMATVDSTSSDAMPTRLRTVQDWLLRSNLLPILSQKHDVAVYRFDTTAEPVEMITHNAPSTAAKYFETDDISDISDIQELVADGSETEIGAAVAEVLQRERGQPLAGIVLITDGGQNSGVSVESALETARRLRIPIFPVGIGAKVLPSRFRIVQFDVPPRVFPNDPFTVQAQIELQGSELGSTGTTPATAMEAAAPPKKQLAVELFLRPANRSTENTAENTATPTSTTVSTTDGVMTTGELIGKKEIEFAIGTVQDVSFDVSQSEVGNKILTLKITPMDINSDSRSVADLQASEEVEVVQRKDRILLFAGGPTRDYQFLRNQLNRDPSMEVDVYLPWTSTGVSQDAVNVLSSFPSDRTTMAMYDTVVAFDPDWRTLSPEQVDVLEHWVSRLGGGLILVAGPVHLTDPIQGWISDPLTEVDTRKIRAMYPVEFFAGQTNWLHQFYSDTQPWPVHFTRSGEEVEFLRLAETAALSRARWGEFAGFYGYMNAKNVKPSATMLAVSSSPDTAGREGTAVLVAEQFYGSGRVLYLGSGEIWRLRMVENTLFERLYTKMIRHVAQGRLLRQSDHGSLSTDKLRYRLGATATIRATVLDDQMVPLTVSSLPLEVFAPGGTHRTVMMKPDTEQTGSYSGHITLQEEGTWRFQMVPPTEYKDNSEPLTRTVRVRMSDLEREHPARHESLLRQIAQESGGHYYDHPEIAAPFVKESPLFGSLSFFGPISSGSVVSDEEPAKPLVEMLKIRSQRAVLDTAAELQMYWVFLWIVVPLLLTEWLFRRLLRLA